jgi:hypothetical protein
MSVSRRSYSFMTAAGGTSTDIYEDGIYMHTRGGTNVAWDFIQGKIHRTVDGNYTKIVGMLAAEAAGDADIALGLHEWGVSL